MIHRYWDINPILVCIFRFYIWLKAGFGHWPGWQKHITAVHRKHHRYSDSVKDPLSPNIYTVKQIVNVEIEPHGVHWISPEEVEKYASDIKIDDSWLERNLYQRYRHLGKILFCLIFSLIFGWAGFLYGFLNLLLIDRYSIYLNTVWVHKVGWVPKYRSPQCHDLSRNSYPWAFFLCGEELHANHHDDPSNPNNARKWWEIDLGFCLAKMLSWIGLVKFNYPNTGTRGRNRTGTPV